MNQYATAIYQGWSTFKQACFTEKKKKKKKKKKEKEKELRKH